MDIKSTPQIELSLILNENRYEFSMPHGVKAEEALEATTYFHACLKKIIDDAEEKSEEEKKSDESLQQEIENSDEIEEIKEE